MRRLADGTLEWAQPLVDRPPAALKPAPPTGRATRAIVAGVGRQARSRARYGRAGGRNVGVPFHAGRCCARGFEPCDEAGRKSARQARLRQFRSHRVVLGRSRHRADGAGGNGPLRVVEIRARTDVAVLQVQRLLSDVQKGVARRRIRVRARRRRQPCDSPMERRRSPICRWPFPAIAIRFGACRSSLRAVSTSMSAAAR